jgi:uncharacterized membrane protein
MTKARLETFSDGVVAILITIMVLELHVPHDTSAAALRPLLPLFLSYLLSFAFLGIYWNNHHHMFHAVQGINGNILWANHHLLFWLSLVPFASTWMGENYPAPMPTALYGIVLLACAIAYTILQNTIIRHQGASSPLRRAVGHDKKGKISALLYVSAIPLAFYEQWLSAAIYVIVALIWLAPDRRIEAALHE